MEDKFEYILRKLDEQLAKERQIQERRDNVGREFETQIYD